MRMNNIALFEILTHCVYIKHNEARDEVFHKKGIH